MNLAGFPSYSLVVTTFLTVFIMQINSANIILHS